jgi:hypothetical protein
MWSGECVHAGLGSQSPCTVNLQGAALDNLISRNFESAVGRRFTVRVLGLAPFGGATDDDCEWRLSSGSAGSAYINLDWSFSSTFGSQRTLKCLLRVAKGHYLEVILPKGTTATSIRPELETVPSQKAQIELRRNGQLLELDSAELPPLIKCESMCSFRDLTVSKHVFQVDS